MAKGHGSAEGQRAIGLARLALVLATLLGTVGLGALAFRGGEDDTSSGPAETVILVHGLGRGPASMAVLGARLRAAGYRVVSLEYASTTAPLEDLVDALAAEVVRCCGADVSGTHFVTHSMGGLLVRAYLGRVPSPSGRVVMLSPPNQGSEIIDAFDESPLLHALLGPAGARLGTDSTDLPQMLGPPDFQLGIIAGDRSINPIGSWLIPGPDDGKVAVERARLQGSAAFKVVPGTHTFLMNRRDVADDVIHFLREGRFETVLVAPPVGRDPAR